MQNCLQKQNLIKVYILSITNFQIYRASMFTLKSVQHLGQSSVNVWAREQDVEMIIFIVAVLIYQVILTINLTCSILKLCPLSTFHSCHIIRTYTSSSSDTNTMFYIILDVILYSLWYERVRQHSLVKNGKESEIFQRVTAEKRPIQAGNRHFWSSAVSFFYRFSMTHEVDFALVSWICILEETH